MPISGSDPALTWARLGVLRLGAGRLGFSPTPPATPSTPSPVDGALQQAPPLTLTWAAAGATSYNIQFGSGPNPPMVLTGHPTASYVPALVPNSFHTWRITAVNAYGATVGPLWTFGTMALPTMPSNPIPSNGANGQGVQPNLSWTAPAPVGGEYDIYLGTDPGALVLVRTQLVPFGTSGGGSYIPATLIGLTTYYWRIVSRNSIGATAGPLWTFTTHDTEDLHVTIGGAAPSMRIDGFTITDALNDAPNTCAFIVDTTEPTLGQEVIIGLGTTDAGDRIFAGTIETIEQVYEGAERLLAWRVTCQDYTRQLRKRKVRKRYAQQSATNIALDLVVSYSAGFTTGGVVAGLPTVTGGIDFTEEDVATCLSRLCARIGAYWYVDYGRVVHVFMEEVSATPDDLVEGAGRLLDEPPLTWAEDLTQIRTRVFVEGGGSLARAPAAVGATSLEVTDAGWYSGAGGLVVSGPQRIAYTGKGTVGGPAPLTAAITNVIGVLGPGPYTYKVTQINAGIEGALSAASAPVSIGPVGNPTGSISAANGGFAAPAAYISWVASTHGGAVDVGYHTYAYTFVTATGETTPSPGRAQYAGDLYLDGGVVAPPSGAPTVSLYTGTLTNSFSWAIGDTIQVRITYGNGHGRTTVGPLSNAVVINPAPGAPSTANAIRLNAFPAAPSGMYTTVWIYKNGAYLGKQEKQSEDYITSGHDTSTGATPPSTNGALTESPARTVNLTAIVTGPGGTTARRIYRSPLGSSTMKLVGTLSNNSATTFSDTVSDAALGANAPTVNTAGGSLAVGAYNWKVVLVTAQGETAANTGQGATITTGAAAVTNVPVSGDARVIARRLYRTAVNGGPYQYEGTINNNSTTTWTSVIPDSALGAVLGDSNQTAGGSKLTLSGIATGGGGVTARKIYRTVSGGSTYKLVATLADNVTTTYLDNITDSALGAVASGDMITALSGIPASGPGSILYEIRADDEINVMVQCDDVPAQVALAAMDGTDGIIEHALQDRRRSLAEATAVGNAELALFSRPIITLSYASRDRKTRSGKTIRVDLPSLGLAGEFVIQSVTLSEIGVAPMLPPRHTVEASSVRFSLEDVLRRLRID